MVSDTNDFLIHYGVKGMKWGVRRSQAQLDRAANRKADQTSNPSSSATSRFKDVRGMKPQTLELKTKSGESVTVRENKKPLIAALAAAAHPNVYKNVKNSSSVSLHAGGKKIGEADYNFQGKNREELYLNMIQVDSKQRGKGYASTVMDAAVEMGRSEGAKRITLDVPDNAPDARHIYEKLGFTQSGKKKTNEDVDVMWGGGLTPMHMDISEQKIKHVDPDFSDVDDEDLANAFDQHFQKLFAPVSKENELDVDTEVEDEDVIDHSATTDFLAHYGVKGMKWGVRRSQAELDRAAGRREKVKEVGLNAKSKVFGVAVKFAPREMTYGLRRAMSNPSTDDREIARLGVESALTNGVLPKNKKVTGAIEKVGIESHKAATYDLDRTDLSRLKKYTDAAWYSRSVNGYLATGKPPNFAQRAGELKKTLEKSSVSDLTVYRSTSLNFSFNGVAKKLETMSESELASSFDSFSKNYKGKTFKENRVFSTSTSPNFAIDTWREVNPNAAANYNTYMIINTKKTPGLLADGRTKNGGKIVNTRSNQEAILAPKTMRYESLSYDKERGMFAITVTAFGDDND